LIQNSLDIFDVFGLFLMTTLVLSPSTLSAQVTFERGESARLTKDAERVVAAEAVEDDFVTRKMKMHQSFLLQNFSNTTLNASISLTYSSHVHVGVTLLHRAAKFN
jgi:hypothetical protein